MKSKTLIVLSIIFVIIWMIIIYCFSETSSQKSNDGSKKIIRYAVELVYKDKYDKEIERIVIKLNKPLRKVAHATVYFVLANFINSVICVFIKNKLYLCNLISITLCFIYASTDEFHQTLVVGRTGLFSDVLIDTSGAIIGCMLFNIIYKMIMKKRLNNL